MKPILIFILISVSVVANDPKYLNRYYILNIFRYSTSKLINQLADGIWEAKSLEEKIGVLDNWLGDNWVTPKPVTTTSPPIYYYHYYDPLDTVLLNQTFARNSAVRYIKAQMKISQLSEYLYNSVMVLGVLNKKDADNLQKIFWTYDWLASTSHSSLFFTECSVSFRNSNIYTGSILKLLDATFRKFEGNKDLSWKLSVDYDDF